MNTKYIKGLAKGALLFAASLFTMTSCGDFFDTESTHIIDADKDRLTTQSDTLYSMIGILNKLQVLGDRTILFGEARGDLMTITNTTNADLRALANFEVGDDNKYNNPADYYAVINNCNYYISRVNKDLQNSRKEKVFEAEYNAVKAIRAWTYLQLVTTYGRVPFVLEPVLSKDMADLSKYPKYDIQQVCDYFINHDGLKEIVANYSSDHPDTYDPDSYEYPSFGVIKSLNSKLFYVPTRLVLADLNLWAGNYLEAAKYYHEYIIKRNGTTSVGKAIEYPIGTYDTSWDNDSWISLRNSITPQFEDFTGGRDSEIISIIPTDSIPSEGVYSELRDIFQSYPVGTNLEASLVPSKSLKNISAAQKYVYYDGSGTYGTFKIAPETMVKSELVGDLRFYFAYSLNENAVSSNNQTYSRQIIRKYGTDKRTFKLPIYRRTLVYLRLAEALNRAGYPHYAYQMLSSGVNTDVITDSIMTPENGYSDAEKQYILKNFDFPGTLTSGYRIVIKSEDKDLNRLTGNTIGIHSRGSGYTPANYFYRNRFRSKLTKEEKIKEVENMIIEEEALEFAFEGYRYYDLLRFALRRTDEPNFLSNTLNARNGGEPSGIKADLSNKANWFLSWKNQIGYNVK